jgi:hypothetical protein
MIAKAVVRSVVALGVGAVVCSSALAQSSYYGYQQYPQQYPYQYQYGTPQQYAPAQTQYAPYQQQYAPTQQYPAQQYSTQQYPAQQYPAQQYAPAQAQPAYAQPAYAPAQAAYTQLPEYCSRNNAATGAIVGSLLGAAIGGAVGGGRGAAIGGASGLLFGGASGAQADAQCRQLAVQLAYEYAAAQQAAIQQQIAQQAATQRGMLSLPASAYEPVSVDYSTPSDSHRHRVTVKRLNSYSEPAARQICDTFTKIDADLDGGTNATTTARRCKGADGQWRDS